MNKPIVIVGGGIAGCTLAWQLHARGQHFDIYDSNEPATSSRIAAGIINPITGPRLALSWRFVEFWREATAFYRYVETDTDSTLFYPKPLVRLFDSERQARLWEDRRTRQEYQSCLCEASTPIPNTIDNTFGSFETHLAGHLNVARFIEITQNYFADCWHAQRVTAPLPDALNVFCDGVAMTASDRFPGIPFRPAKGEILTLAVSDLPADAIFNRGGVWLFPVGERIFRAGATYDWDARDTKTTTQAREYIVGRLKRWLRVPFEVIDHQAAVRPIVQGGRPICGLHPNQRHIGIMNGLGSKGVLMAPTVARALAQHITDGSALDAELDVGRFM